MPGLTPVWLHDSSHVICNHIPRTFSPVRSEHTPPVQLARQAKKGLTFAGSHWESCRFGPAGCPLSGGKRTCRLSRAADGRLSLRWIESSGQPVITSPMHRGFGTRVMENLIGQLKGEVRFDWRDQGLTCGNCLAACIGRVTCNAKRGRRPDASRGILIGRSRSSPTA